jgi:uncharacterized membrane protein
MCTHNGVYTTVMSSTIRGEPMKALKQNKYLINMALSAIAIGVIVFYSICGNSCSYLKGNILGIELQYIGIVFMAALIFLNLLKKDLLILISLSAGIGVEIFLLGFQVVHNKYCPYCLVFSAIILAQFLLGFRRTDKWFAISSAIIGFVLFASLFEGSAFPTYF